jgi:BTB/POZ domain
MSTTHTTDRPAEDTSPTKFGPPFDDPDADVIFRSSDLVDFHVYKVILSKASPWFKDTFASQPRGNDKARPILNLREPSGTWKTLLTVIYRVTSDETLSLDDHLSVIAAAKEYNLVTASLHLQDFEKSASMQENPVMAFCAAYTLQLGEAARIAAKASLQHRFNLDDIGHVLQQTTGPALSRLWQFHRACSTAALAAIADDHFSWFAPAKKGWWEIVQPDRVTYCKCDKRTLGFGPQARDRRAWHNSSTIWHAHVSWGNYINRARDALREHPCSKAVTHLDILKPSYEEPMCDTCQQSICGLSEFSRCLGEEVDKRVSQVRKASASPFDASLTGFLFFLRLL